MEKEKAYLVGIHRYSYRAGIPGEIIGVKLIRPKESMSFRLCYHVRWSDDKEDYVPAVDIDNYTIISFTDILNGEIPPVSR